MKKLIIVESPSKIAKVSEALGDNYVVKACFGHITELAKNGHANTGVDIEKNFKAKYVISPDKYKVVGDLMDSAKGCDTIYLCTDPDREGESISWHLKERLATLDIPFKRCTFNEITKSAISKALKNARDIDYKLVESQETRRILDRLVGYKVSPYLMKTFTGSMSAGRVQSVAVRLICEREKDIEAFKPEDFFNVYADIKHPKKSFKLKLDGKFLKKEDAESCVSKIIQGSKLIVKKVDSDKKPEYPQPPLITSSLQQVMAKKFSFSAEDTMQIAQSLYERGLITYLRTDSLRASPEATEGCRTYISGETSFKLSPKENVYKNKDSSQDAHECIRPTDLELKSDNDFIFTSNEEKQVYDMIWKYFVASQCAPAIYNTLRITALDVSSTYSFKVSGKSISDPGYLAVFGDVSMAAIDLPDLSVGDEFEVNSKNLSIEKKKTQPPERYNVASIIKEMDSRGIGRPATFAQILKNIIARNYVEKKGNTYYGTELGIKVVDTLNKYFKFMNYKFTADMEKALDDIHTGKSDKGQILDSFYKELSVDLTKAYIDAGYSMCPTCGSPLVDRKNSKTNETFKGCSGYPKCRFVFKG